MREREQRSLYVVFYLIKGVFDSVLRIVLFFYPKPSNSLPVPSHPKFSPIYLPPTNSPRCLTLNLNGTLHKVRTYERLKMFLQGRSSHMLDHTIEYLYIYIYIFLLVSLFVPFKTVGGMRERDC